MFRGATRSDLPEILKIYARARETMAAAGNPAAIIVTSLLKKVTPETCQDFIDETLPSLLATASSISRLAGAPA